ncbi:hypothetical protein Tco_0788093 [Tanacetum coccineum]
MEQQKATAKADVALLKDRSSYPDVNQLTTLLVTSLKPELSKLLASHNFTSCLPTDLKELPSKFTELSREIKELNQHVKDMEIELPGNLKEIPTKLETFTSTISSLTSQVAELKNIQWELLVELQALPVLFATVLENASEATTKNVPSAGQATASPAEGEKNTKDAETNLKMNSFLKKSPKITNYEILTKKGPITLKIYKEDVSEEVISNPSSALQVLRRLKSIFTSVYAVVQKLKKDSWKELQFSLLDNSKLNVDVYYCDESEGAVQQGPVIPKTSTHSSITILRQRYWAKCEDDSGSS